MDLFEVLRVETKAVKRCELDEEQDAFRFVLLALIGGFVALCGMLANSVVAYLFVARFNYRHSPFFFMGFVAFFDCLFDFLYLLIMALPMAARQFYWDETYVFWLANAKALMLMFQIVKLASIFCLIVASYERFSLTKHWTNSGFEYPIRWVLLIAAIGLSVLVRGGNPTNYEIKEREECRSMFTRFLVERVPSTNGVRSLLDLATVALPFFTLVYLNVQIVLKIRKQNVQDLRSLITQLTLGRDLMEVRRENLRSATRSLLFILTAYLISNSLSLLITVIEYYRPVEGYYEQHYPDISRFVVELSNLLAVFGNVLRPPAHLFANAELREHMSALVCGRWPAAAKKKLPKLKGLENIHHAQYESPWFSALLTTARDRVGGKCVEIIVSEDYREPLCRRRSIDACHPLFDRESFRRLSNVGIV